MRQLELYTKWNLKVLLSVVGIGEQKMKMQSVINEALSGKYI